MTMYRTFKRNSLESFAVLCPNDFKTTKTNRVYSRRPTDKGWKTVRIFVSSTFTDFYCEREILVKMVLPILRFWCEEQGLWLRECDLRWGIPQESSGEQTVRTCMETIEQCSQETFGKPFFIHLSGQRCGWIPSSDELSEELRSEYDWVEGMSITGMEVLEAAFRLNNPNCLFIKRNPSYLEEVPWNFISRFKEGADKVLEKKLIEMLDKEVERKFADRRLTYDATVHGVELIDGKEQVRIRGLESLQDDIVNFFKNAIEQTFGNDLKARENQSMDERVRLESEFQSVMARRASQHVGHHDYMDIIKKFCLDGSADSCPLLVLTGEPGCGKSSILAKMAEDLCTSGISCFWHSADALPEAESVEKMQQRLQLFLNEENQTIFKEIIEKKRDSNLVIILDGVDQLDTTMTVNHLDWLSSPTSPTCRVVLSTSNHLPTVARLQQHQTQMLSISGNLQLANDIATSYFENYNKRLSHSQLQLLVNHEGALLPLWMATACSMLRVCGNFRAIEKYIVKLPAEIGDLIEKWITNILEGDGNGLIEKALGLIACSSRGILEEDLMELLVLEHQNTPERTKSLLMDAHWIEIWCQIKEMMLRFNKLGRPAIRIKMKAINQVVLNMIKKNNLLYHCLLADFFTERRRKNPNSYKEELLDHLLAANRKQQLINLLRTDFSMFPNPFNRYIIVKHLRCSQICLSNSSSTLMLCQFCGNKRGIFGATGSAAQSCCVCGDWCPHSASQQSSPTLCAWHRNPSAPNQTLCFVCKNVIVPQMKSTELKLCRSCGFSRNQCIQLMAE